MKTVQENDGGRGSKTYFRTDFYLILGIIAITPTPHSIRAPNPNECRLQNQNPQAD